MNLSTLQRATNTSITTPSAAVFVNMPRETSRLRRERSFPRCQLASLREHRALVYRASARSSPPALLLFEQLDEFLAKHDTMLSKFVAASDCGRVIRLVTLGIYALAKPIRSAADDDRHRAERKKSGACGAAGVLGRKRPR
jgi:hypothetical protein